MRKKTADIASRLRAFREAGELTQEELAHRAQVAAKYVSEIENGHVNPSVGILAKLVERGLGVPLAAFFSKDAPGDVRDDLTKLEAMFAGQPSHVRKRALRVLAALCDE